MKISVKVIRVIVFLFALPGSIAVANAQKQSGSKDLVRNLLDSQRYVFHAERVTPMTGRQRFLTTDYTLSISKDTIQSDLPYFGRAYSAPINPSEGGIIFTSTDFDYQPVPRKKGGWDITINLKDTRDTRQLKMTVFENGSASLQVDNTDRQPISFRGHVTGKHTR